MEYQEFIEYVKDNTLYLTGEGGTATINHVIKNNGCELDGLVLMEKDNDIAPTIYLNRLYEEYKRGKDIDAIIREIETIYVAMPNNMHYEYAWWGYSNIRRVSCLGIQKRISTKTNHDRCIQGAIWQRACYRSTSCRT